MRTRKSLLAIALTFMVVAGCSQAKNKNQMDYTTVDNVDLNRYMGTWYEIARFPHRFERGLVGVTATYTLREDGRIDVLNQGYRGALDGELSRANAKAKVPDPGRPGHLKVYFFWLFGASYNIMELDTVDYQYALVGSSTPNYLWILSRTTVLDEDDYSMLVERARARGYDVTRLERVPHRK
jgi:lipocalin